MMADQVSVVEECTTTIQEKEHQLMELVKTAKSDTDANAVETIHQLLAEGVDPNTEDSTGMSALMNAASKGKSEVVKMLLESGAEANGYDKKNHYTPLMFGAMSGNLETVDLLLAAGANKYAVNTIGKSATALASFVGQHHTSARINGFITMADIEVFTKKFGLETEPRIPKEQLPFFHKFILFNELVPAPLVGFLKKHPELVCEGTAKALRTLSETYIIEHSNESTSIKLHYLACIIERCLSQEGGIESLVKFLWKKKNGFRFGEEAFVRQSIRTYKHQNVEMFFKLVRSIAPIEVGQHPSAIEVLSGTLNGPLYRSVKEAADEEANEASTKQAKEPEAVIN